MPLWEVFISENLSIKYEMSGTRRFLYIFLNLYKIMDKFYLCACPQMLQCVRCSKTSINLNNLVSTLIVCMLVVSKPIVNNKLRYIDKV